MSHMYAPTKGRLLPIVFAILAMLILLTPTLVLGQGMPETHTYQFYNGATLVRTQIVQNGEMLYEPPTPTTPPGKIFDGWRIGGVPVTFGPQTVTSTQTFRVDATFKDGYYVRFVYDEDDQLGQTGPKSAITLATKLVAPGGQADPSTVSYVISEAGQTFSHWSETPGGPAFDFTTGINESKTFYLVTKAGVTFTYNTHGGSYIDPQYYNQGENTVQPPIPQKTGYSFSHWSTDENNATGPFAFGNAATANTTLHAIWTPVNVSYTILYHLQNAEDDGYTVVGSRNKSGLTGSAPTHDPTTEFIDAEPASNESVERRHYEYSHKDEGLTIAADGSTVLNVYYNRRMFPFTIRVCNRNSGGGCSVSEYVIISNALYKYGQSTAPTYEQAINHPHYKGYVWRTRSGGNVFWSEAPLMLDQVQNNTTYYLDEHPLQAWGFYNGDRRYLYHYIEIDDTFCTNQTTCPQVRENGQPVTVGLGSIRPAYEFFAQNGLRFTIEDGAIYSPGFELYRFKPDESSNITVARWIQLHTVAPDNHYEGTIYYRRLNYQITFYRNDGAAGNEANPFVVPNRTPYQADLSNLETTYVTELTLPDRVVEGVTYQFTGWYTDIGYSGLPYDFVGKTMPPSDLNFYAKWEPKPIKLHYCKTIEGDTCTFISVTPKKTLDPGQVAAIQLYKNLPPGMGETDFVGWFVKRNGKLVPFDLDNDTIEAETTIYPYYKGNTLTVKYEVGAGSGTPPVDPNDYVYSSHADVLAPGAALTPRPGTEFCGWKLRGDTTPKIYYPLDNVRVDDNKVFIAQFCPLPATTQVTYRAGYGTVAPVVFPNLPINTHHTVMSIGTGADEINFTRPGWEFVSWLGADGNNYSPGDIVLLLKEGAAPSQKNIFTAQWRRQTVDITAKKTWNGGPASAHIAVDLRLTRKLNGTAQAWTAPNPTVTPGGSGVFNYTWSGVESHSPDGTAYEYQVIENLTPDQAALADPVITQPDPANQPYHWVVTNNYKSPKIEVAITKVWQGGFYLDKPNIPIKLIGTCQAVGGGTCARIEKEATIGMTPGAGVSPVNQELDAGNYRESWKYTFTDLPKYDLSGAEYKYQIMENWAPGTKPTDWISSCASEAAVGTERLTCTNTYDPPLVPTDPGDPDKPTQVAGEVTGVKKWLGGAKTGYADVKLQLKRQWKQDLNQDCVAGVNACGPVEPAKLKAPGEPNAPERKLEALTLCPDPNAATPCAPKWKTVWNQLPERDQQTGYPFLYSIIEVDVGAIRPSNPIMGAFVQVVEDPDTTPLEVTNKYVPPLVNEGDPDPTTNDGEVKGQKIWSGGQLSEHKKVTLKLTRQWKQKPADACGPANECGSVEEYFTPRDDTTPITDLVISEADAKASNSQSRVWIGLAMREFANGYMYVYTVSELETDAELAPYKQVAKPDNLTVKNQYQSGTQTITAVKDWIGGDPAARPSFTFQLCRTSGTDFAVCGDAAVLGTRPSTGPLTWDNVETHDPTGKPYKYWVIESAVPANYEPVNRGNLATLTSEERLKITNKYKSPKLPAFVGEIKWWGDGGATTHRRDTSLQLYRSLDDGSGICQTGGESVSAAVNVPKNGFAGGVYTVSFTGMDEFNPDGKKYCYYVDIVDGGGPIQIVGDPAQVHYKKVRSELSVDLSDFDNNDLVVDLRLSQPNVKVEVRKEWVGGENAGPRPADVYFQLQRCFRTDLNATTCRGGSVPADVVGYRELWTGTKITWYGLPSEDPLGNKYLYSVIEVKADGTPWTHDYYTANIGSVTLGAMSQSYTVKNEFHGKKIPGGITGTLEWIPDKAALKSIVTIQLCRHKEGNPGAKECTGTANPIGSQTSKMTGNVADTSVNWPEHADLVDRAPDGSLYVYTTVHDGPAYDGNMMVYDVDPKDSARPLHLVYRYVPRTIKIKVDKTWTNKGQLVRTPVEVTLYGGAAGADQPVPSTALSNKYMGMVDANCVTTNPMVITPTATALADVADHTVTKYWCVPADDANAAPYKYTAKETKVNYIFWEPVQPTNEISGHADNDGHLNANGAFAVENKFKPPLINYEDNDPDCPPNTAGCTHDPNGDDGKMRLNKRWVGGAGFRVPVAINLLRNEDGNPANTDFEDNTISPKTLTLTDMQPGDVDLWTKEFTGIPGMSENGEKYIYKIAELVVPVGFDNPPISPVIDQTTRTVTNKYNIPTGTVKITVTIDGGNPSSIGTNVKLTCKYNGTEVWVSNPEISVTGFSGANCVGLTCRREVVVPNVPKTDDNGNPLQCEIDHKDIPGFGKTPSDPGPKPFPNSGTIELGINYQYRSDTDKIIGTKRWIDGESDGPRPTVYFQLWRKIGAAGVPEPVPGAAIMELMNGTLTVEWQNVDLYSPAAERYTHIIKEVSDMSGMNPWINPKYIVQDMDGLTVVNKYKIPTGTIVGKKEWRYKLPIEPIPTVHLKLFRRIPPSGAWQEVPGQPVMDLLAGAMPYEVTWNDVEKTDSSGKAYEFIVREVDPLGNDYVPDGYAKIENGNEVVNERLGRLFVWVTPTPESYEPFEIIGTNDEMSTPHSQIVDNDDVDPTYPKRFQWDNVKKARTAFWIDRLDLAKWDVTGIDCKSRPYGAAEATPGTDFSVQAKRTFTGRMTGEFAMQEMPTGRDVYCEIKLTNLKAAKIVVRNVTIPIPGKTIDPLDYATTGLGFTPFTMMANGPEKVQEVTPGEFTLKQTKTGADWAEWDTIDVTVSSSIIRRNPLISLSSPAFSQDAELRFNVVDSEVVTITFYNVPKNTIMLKKITHPANAPEYFEFAGVLEGRVRHNEVLMRQMTPDGKYHQAIEVPKDGWAKHSVWCVERGAAGYVNNLVTRPEFYTMSAWYGLDEGETILCTFANRGVGEEDFPDIPDPDIPGFTDFLPRTGFAPGRVTEVAEQPASKLYQSSNLKLTIPKLGQSLEIVGVPETSDGWDVSWLGNSAGYLMGTTFPTWDGNSVITAHVWDAYNNPGPFAELKNLVYGDRFEIEAYGRTFIYEVRESEQIRAGDVARVVKQDAIGNMTTLLTCEAYDEAADKYEFRRLVRAVLVDTK